MLTRILLVILFAAAIGSPVDVAAADDALAHTDKPRITVSILPLKYFVDRLVGNEAHVDVLVQPGHSPTTYRYTTRQWIELGKTDLFIRIGVPVETRLVERIGSEIPGLRIVDGRQGIPLAESGHEHGNMHGDCAHEDLDPHIWMSPRLALRILETIADALCELDGIDIAAIRAREVEFEAELRLQDQQIRERLTPYEGRSFFVYHAAFGYFARDYGLQQVAVEVGGKEPGPRQLAELIDKARADDVRVIFVQPQFSSRAAETLAEEIGGVVVPVDPLAYDYIDNLNKVADAIASGLNGEEVSDD